MADREIERIRQVYQGRISSGVIERYSADRPGERYLLERREAEILALLGRRSLDLAQARILEVGCGRGDRLADWLKWGAVEAKLAGIDLMEPFLTEARARLPQATLATASGDRLPFADASFDVVSQLTVFTSILDKGLKERIAAEMRRVLKPGGFILWFDFRYPSHRNRDVRPVGRREIAELFPGARIEIKSVTLLPPLARRLAPVSPGLCRVLESLPFLRSHYLAAIEP